VGRFVEAKPVLSIRTRFPDERIHRFGTLLSQKALGSNVKKYWSDGTTVAGQQFEYAFDDIGNRAFTKAGGDQNGTNLGSAAYAASKLNQYASRDVSFRRITAEEVRKTIFLRSL